MEEFRVFENVEQLKRRTVELLKLCHAPYSNFRVTSVVLAQSKTNTSDRRVFNGVNVECASYSLCMCAERVAIYNAVSSGYTNILKVAIVCMDVSTCQTGSDVVTDNLKGCWPCGACRQVISEFSEDTACEIITIDKDGQLISKDIKELLPNTFKLTEHVL